MSPTAKTDPVWFTTKGQVVIPAWLRRQFHIENGTKAVVQATPEGILLKPVTAAAIRRLRGILNRKPGGKSFDQEWPNTNANKRNWRKSNMPAAQVLDSHALSQTLAR